MKIIKNQNKLYLLILLISLVFSCTSDDDVNGIVDCYSCENLQTDYCYTEGDAFYISILNNQTTEIELNGQTWEEIKIALEINCIESLGNYALGYFIVNEGSFGSGIGTLSFVANDGTVSHDVYQTVNGEPMGNLLQSMYFHDDKAYLVLNGSHKIIVTNRYTMEKLAVIEGDQVNNPRYFVAIGDKGYISNWNDPFNTSDDFIAVVNLTTNTIESTIAIGEGPEDMLINDDKLYVNLQGGFGQNNQLVIINTTTNAVLSSLTVGDVPNSITVDVNNDIWILCEGKPSFTGNETAGGLYRIKNDAVLENLDFNTTEHPSFLSINNAKNTLYYNLNGNVYKQPNQVNSTSTIAVGFDGFYYGMTINNDKLYTLDAGNFTSEGTLKIFDLNSGANETITTGIIPNSVIFQ